MAGRNITFPTKDPLDRFTVSRRYFHWSIPDVVGILGTQRWSEMENDQGPPRTKTSVPIPGIAKDTLAEETPVATLQQERTIAQRYRLVGRLGSGGAGIVFRAVDLQRESAPVAVKVLAPIDFKDPTAKERFEKEISLTRDFDHPNLVKVYDFGMTDTGQQFVTMELVDGGTLSGRIYNSESPLSFQETLFILRDVARGVGAAHAQGIVHRDLKPDNILIAKNGTAKVADFGLAREMAAGHTITHSADTVGTPYYMAPEQFRHHRVDGRADIYSLGIIAFEMVTRRRPFTSDVYQMLAMAHMQHPMPSFHDKGKNIPKWYETFVFRCTEKRANARFQKMEEIVQYLEYELRRLGHIEGGPTKEPWWIRLFTKMLGED